MHLKIRYMLLTILFSLFFMQAFAVAQSPDQKQKTGKGKGSSDIVFPEVEGWEKGSVTNFPLKDLGYSIGYQSENGDVVTVYVYDGGERNIADGIDDSKVKAQLRNAENDINAMVEMGRYDSAEKIKSDTVTLGGADGKVKSLRSAYKLGVGDREIYSEIYLFGYNKNFIKFRVSRLYDEENDESEDVENFLKEMDKVFSK